MGGVAQTQGAALILDARPPQRGPLAEPALLMVEVLAASPRDVRRDRHDNPREYRRLGVPNLWLVDPDGRSIEGLG